MEQNLEEFVSTESYAGKLSLSRDFKLIRSLHDNTNPINLKRSPMFDPTKLPNRFNTAKLKVNPSLPPQKEIKVVHPSQPQQQGDSPKKRKEIKFHVSSSSQQSRRHVDVKKKAFNCCVCEDDRQIDSEMDLSRDFDFDPIPDLKIKKEPIRAFVGSVLKELDEDNIFKPLQQDKLDDKLLKAESSRLGVPQVSTPKSFTKPSVSNGQTGNDEVDDFINAHAIPRASIKRIPTNKMSSKSSKFFKEISASGRLPVCLDSKLSFHNQEGGEMSPSKSRKSIFNFNQPKLAQHSDAGMLEPRDLEMFKNKSDQQVPPLNFPVSIRKRKTSKNMTLTLLPAPQPQAPLISFGNVPSLNEISGQSPQEFPLIVSDEAI